ncbi:MAG TPA: DUF4129 domain-containing protein [Spirochaetota bacterium]
MIIDEYPPDMPSEKECADKRPFLYRVIEFILFYIVFYSLSNAFIITGFNQKRTADSEIYLLVPFLVLFVATEIIQNVISGVLAVIILSILMLVAAMFIVNSDPVIYYFIMLLVFFLVYQGVGRVRFGLPHLTGYCVALIASYIVLHSYDSFMTRFTLFGFVVTIIIGIVYVAGTRFDTAIRDEIVSPLDEEKTRRALVRLSVAVGVIVIMIVAVSGIIAHQSRIGKYDDALSHSVSRILSLDHRIEADDDTDALDKLLKKPRSRTHDGVPVTGFLKYFSLILSTILVVVSSIILVVAPVLFVIMIFKIYRSIFGFDADTDDDVHTQNLLSVREIIARAKMRLRVTGARRDRTSARSDKQRIRKLYRETVLRITESRRLAVRQSSTPREIESIIFPQGSHPFSEATDVYERARYSDRDNPDGDMTAMQRLRSVK